MKRIVLKRKRKPRKGVGYNVTYIITLLAENINPIRIILREWMGMKFIRRYWNETDCIETEEKNKDGGGI